MSIKINKVKCVRCGKKTQLSLLESKLKDGVLITYCYNPKHRKIKMKVITRKNIPRQIRESRRKLTKEYEEEFNMKNLKCPCGHKLAFDRFGSHQASGKVKANCFNNSLHRLDVLVLGKLVKREPTCEEFFEIILSQYQF